MGLFDFLSGPDINAKVSEARTDADVVILDVRTRAEYEAGHIEDAVCIPLAEVDKAARIYKDKHLYVHCASGARSKQSVARLQAAGHQNAENIGGIQAWRGDIVR